MRVGVNLPGPFWVSGQVKGPDPKVWKLLGYVILGALILALLAGFVVTVIVGYLVFGLIDLALWPWRRRFPLCAWLTSKVAALGAEVPQDEVAQP